MKEETKPETTPEVTAAEKPLPKPEEKKEVKEHPDDKIARAEAVADRIEEANKVAATQIEEMRTLKVNEALGGETVAGQAPVEKKELTDKEYSDKVMAGENPDAKTS